jgi:hypothetical protein
VAAVAVSLSDGAENQTFGDAGGGSPVVDRLLDPAGNRYAPEYPSGQAHPFTGAMCVLNLVHE